MKHALIAFLLAAQIATAQQATTNLVTAAPNFREIDGKLYNVDKSVLWRPIAGKCDRVKEDGIILQTFTTNYVYERVQVRGNGGNAGAYGSTSDRIERRLASSSATPDKRIFVRMETKEMANGQQVDIRAFQFKATTNIDGDILELWDYGKPHVVAVARTNTPAISR